MWKHIRKVLQAVSVMRMKLKSRGYRPELIICVDRGRRRWRAISRLIPARHHRALRSVRLAAEVQFPDQSVEFGRTGMRRFVATWTVIGMRRILQQTFGAADKLRFDGPPLLPDGTI
jgi:hypothetical protein